MEHHIELVESVKLFRSTWPGLDTIVMLGPSALSKRLWRLCCPNHFLFNALSFETVKGDAFSWKYLLDMDDIVILPSDSDRKTRSSCHSCISFLQSILLIFLVHIFQVVFAFLVHEYSTNGHAFSFCQSFEMIGVRGEAAARRGEELGVKG